MVYKKASSSCLPIRFNKHSTAQHSKQLVPSALGLYLFRDAGASLAMALATKGPTGTLISGLASDTSVSPRATTRSCPFLVLPSTTGATCWAAGGDVGKLRPFEESVDCGCALWFCCNQPATLEFVEENYRGRCRLFRVLHQ